MNSDYESEKEAFKKQLNLKSIDGNAEPPSNAIAQFEASRCFSAGLLGLQVAVMLVLFGLELAYGTTLETDLASGKETSDTAAALSLQLYNYYIGVALMMFIGFGYLMTFLRWYGLGAVGLTMIITCLGVEATLVIQALTAILSGTANSFVIDLSALLQANFAVAAFLISFGGLIGKVNPAQLVVLVTFESVFYSLNKWVMEEVIAISDVGGTIVIHEFGAYFGLAIAFVLGVPAVNMKEKASYVSDLFSLLGTVILYVYWPSFVAGATPAGTPDAELQLVQTILSLASATVVTFALSSMLSEDGKLRPVDVQNATLAGGVAIGVLAGTPLTSAGAMLVGGAAGALSTWGFMKLSPWLYCTIGLHDSCGIHNLHGMPSLLGAALSVALPAFAPNVSDFSAQTQLYGAAVTLGAAICTGIFTGFAMKCLADGAEMGSDLPYWEVADDFGREPPDEDLATLLKQKMNGQKMNGQENGRSPLEA